MSPSIDTRQRLLVSAWELIYTRSYADVGVQAICDHADVKKGSFYHHFPSKQALTLALLDDFLLDFEQDLLGQAFTKDLPPMARFGQLIELIYQFQMEVFRGSGHLTGCPFGNLAAELSTVDEAIRVKLASIFDRLQQGFRATLREAVDGGSLGGIDIPATAQAMFAYLEGVLLLAKTHNDPQLIRQLAPALTAIRVPSAS
jgi:TetR/AcrR family transcriptional repressor of nem operon